MMTLVNYHRVQVVYHEQQAETLISNANHLIIPEYITNVPDITNNLTLFDLNFQKRPPPKIPENLKHREYLLPTTFLPVQILHQHQLLSCLKPTTRHQQIQKTGSPPRAKTSNALGDL